MPVGYRLYAASPADFLGSGEVGSPLIIATATLTVYTADSGGVQVTDLLDAAEAPVSVITPDNFGNFRFFAADTLGTLWVTADGGSRYAVQPADLGDRMAAVGDVGAIAADAADAAAAAIAAQAAAESAQDVMANHTHTLSDLTDVDLTTNPPAVGETIVWDGTEWVPGEVTGGGGGIVAETLATAPAGSTFVINYYDTVFSPVNTWPAARPSTRGDIYFVWRGPSDPGSRVGAHDTMWLVQPNA